MSKSATSSLLRNLTLIYLIGVSFFGLFVVGMLGLNQPTVRESFPWRKPVIGSIFGSICILGIWAVFFARKCSLVSDLKKEGEVASISADELAPHRTSPTMRGHHPDCERFSAHIFRIGERTFCTGCTGLLVGGLAALVGAVLYFFGNWRIEQGGFLVIWVGVLGVGAGLLQFPLFNTRRSLVRLSLNTFFILGMFLILIGADGLAGNLFVDLFLICLSAFWLFTRMSLSRWDHRRICYACEVETCKFLHVS